MHEDWSAIRFLPNVALEQPLETSQVALMSCCDERVQGLAHAYPAFGDFLGKFRDEFGMELEPTVLLYRSDSPQTIRTLEALAGFRDLVCISAVCASYVRDLLYTGGAGFRFSNAFDFYPWFFGRQYDDTIFVQTASVLGTHNLSELNPQCSPAFSVLSLQIHHLDLPLYRGLRRKWEDAFAGEGETQRNRRLFRSLNMARAAARMPGGPEVDIYDIGRVIALWISACEILIEEGKGSKFKVLKLLNKVDWKHGSFSEERAHHTLYMKLYNARNDFLHGKPVSIDTLEVADDGSNLFKMAAPLYRCALSAFLSEEGISGRDEGVSQDADADIIEALRDMEIERTQMRVEEALLKTLPSGTE
ncbi:hypothetical protein FP2506_11457 [Fulvimarina pelagi HTCC2506]|uniref:Apea-like HEPN domain-containing protein n=1 Tax=Fulvimarina pelagi HTCC2506 TaxID=314231 RepID=Q0FYY8_9HYPH|nr:hypothetical protein [Fulvimarina pelagi]EAU40170.1 hypothetical protein FP2506_11457 [Fulvimarina pelagi HTCC2506]